MVGPVRLNYGTTVAAGTILRRDELRANRLIFGGIGKGGNIEFQPGRYSGSSRIIKNNLIYIANLLALRQWYQEVRVLFVGDEFPRGLFEGLMQNVRSAIVERMRRLMELAEKMKAGGDPVLAEAWPGIEEKLARQHENTGDLRLAEAFKEKVASRIAREGKDYITVVRSLSREDTETGTAWLQGIVDEAVAEAFAAID
jgi:UDP-N-acetylglucosamine/UDP-N-acetylgalactosamine diphosphorylase